MYHDIAPTTENPRLLGADEGYQVAMAEFEMGGNAYVQPQDVSDRAAGLAIDAVTRYPQTTRGNPLILADRLLEAFNPPSRSSTGIGMIEAAQAMPDAQKCADRVNAVHTQFGIPYRVNQRQAITFIAKATVNALEAIKDKTQSVAREIGMIIPAELANRDIRVKPIYTHTEGPWSFDREAVKAWHDFLADNDGLRQIVMERIKTEADAVRADSRAQQQRAQAGLVIQQALRDEWEAEKAAWRKAHGPV